MSAHEKVIIPTNEFSYDRLTEEFTLANRKRKPGEPGASIKSKTTAYKATKPQCRN